MCSFNKLCFITVLLFFLNDPAISQNTGEKYLGLDPPGDKAIVFAPGSISYGFHELGLRISPAGDEYLYITSDKAYTIYRLVVVKKQEDIWQSPELAGFANHLSIYSVSYAPDGNKLFLSGFEIGSVRENTKLLVSKKVKENWSIPLELRFDNPDNISLGSPSVAQNGNIYCNFRGSGEQAGLYCIEFKDGKYAKPQKLDIALNEPLRRPYISSDENILMFQANQDEGMGENDIYICFKKERKLWTDPILLGPKVNTGYNDFGASLSPDGRYLFYSSYKGLDPKAFAAESYAELMKAYKNPKNGYATLYWIKADFIQNLKHQAIR